MFHNSKLQTGLKEIDLYSIGFHIRKALFPLAFLAALHLLFFLTIRRCAHSGVHTLLDSFSQFSFCIRESFFRSKFKVKRKHIIASTEEVVYHGYSNNHCLRFDQTRRIPIPCNNVRTVSVVLGNSLMKHFVYRHNCFPIDSSRTKQWCSKLRQKSYLVYIFPLKKSH